MILLLENWQNLYGTGFSVVRESYAIKLRLSVVVGHYKLIMMYFDLPILLYFETMLQNT